MNPVRPAVRPSRRAGLRSGSGSAPAVTLALLIASLAAAATAGANDADSKGAPTLAIPRHVIASGGGDSSAGVFALRGTIGQGDADPLQPSTGGVYAITGGFWVGAPLPVPPAGTVFANGFESL